MREVLGTPDKLSDSDAMEMKRELSRPKYDWPRHSLQISLQTARGLCKTTSKCVRHEDHAGKCWPDNSLTGREARR